MFLNPPKIMLFIGEIAGLLRLEDGTPSKPSRVSWKYLYQSELRKETSFICFLHHTVGFCHLFECIMLCGSLAKGIGTLDHLKKHTCAVVLQSLVLDFDSAYNNSSSKLTSHYFYTLIYNKVVHPFCNCLAIGL